MRRHRRPSPLRTLVDTLRRWHAAKRRDELTQLAADLDAAGLHRSAASVRAEASRLDPDQPKRQTARRADR